MPTTESTNRRRSGRLEHRIPVILNGIDHDGFNFGEETDTLTVSKHGACLRTAYELRLGQEVSVRTKENNRVGQFVVVWTGEPGTPNGGLVGIEWVEVRRFWGVEFPPDDWASGD
jgi:PilZ domain